MRVQKKIRTSFYFSSFPLVFLSTRSGEVGHRRLAESETFEVESCKNALGGRAANPGDRSRARLGTREIGAESVAALQGRINETRENVNRKKLLFK